ncbi:SDR family oxidoreductase [Flavobacterium sp. N1736]|uniref:SDR family oxidoreductase n=1 Tax=Flavobacterium sp. N1736 TaxID=2986823 RepID=UPI0022254A7A|nr:SDR family NAD(P)-dependent oxidoreductase [Flavobacterium sp. N1736]
MNLKNNTVLITGGTSGFGLAFATKFLALGNTVIITGRDQAKLDAIKIKHPEIHTIQSDVSDVNAIRELYNEVANRFSKLNLLINNAGEMRIISLHDTAIDLHDITREVEINLMGPIRMVQQFLPLLKKQPSAAILNVSSGLAVVPFPISPIYGASKSGLHAYTRALRVQLKHTKIKVFELLAPASKTPLGDKFAGLDGFSDSGQMEPEKVVDAAIKRLENDKLEMFFGIARLLYILSRLAPGFIFNQLSKAGAKRMAG